MDNYSVYLEEIIIKYQVMRGTTSRWLSEFFGHNRGETFVAVKGSKKKKIGRSFVFFFLAPPSPPLSLFLSHAHSKDRQEPRRIRLRTRLNHCRATQKEK